ncbi:MULTISPECIES: hypothetical protein [Saccharopolyspora]|uniref:Uncharacterized protein n=1 Tax=Saccharopolyspora elongata TaxID=2530387 RepID=A0A4V2YNP5_9PSEU|nr:hypothetical protein [Saccharopolyspora elongata]TDD55187.1 hypothetical protein E1288_05080 [Saccharopolyspora elongata]
MPPQELLARPQWRRTGDTRFPVAATVDGRSWVLRLNSFPDHPLWTLFVDGAARFDTDSTPPTWGKPLNRAHPALAAATAEEILAPVRDFVAYGSEAGTPCDDPFCCG